MKFRSVLFFFFFPSRGFIFADIGSCHFATPCDVGDTQLLWQVLDSRHTRRRAGNISSGKVLKCVNELLINLSLHIFFFNKVTLLFSKKVSIWLNITSLDWFIHIYQLKIQDNLITSFTHFTNPRSIFKMLLWTFMKISKFSNSLNLMHAKK